MNTKLSLLFVISMFMMAGCGQGSPSFSVLPTGDTFKQSAASFNNQLDILWVVDNSGSMGPLQTNLVSNFNSFISNFQTQGYDFRMAVTTSDAYKADPTLNGYSSSNSGLAKFSDGTNPFTNVFVIIPSTPNLASTFVTNATTGSNGSGDERVFSSFRTALNSSLNPSFLRSTSFFSIIILSDEDDFSGNGRCENCGTDHNYNASTLDTVASYENYLDALTVSTGVTRRYNVNSIAVLDSACQQSHVQQSSTTIIGQRYIQMTNDTQGILGSVCDASFSTSLNNIAGQIATLSTQFYLTQTPQVSTIVVLVNNVTIPQNATNGWTYSSTNNAIQFHGTGVPPQGANINVSFVPTSGHAG